MWEICWFRKEAVSLPMTRWLAQTRIQKLGCLKKRHKTKVFEVKFWLASDQVCYLRFKTRFVSILKKLVPEKRYCEEFSSYPTNCAIVTITEIKILGFFHRNCCQNAYPSSLAGFRGKSQTSDYGHSSLEAKIKHPLSGPQWLHVDQR